MFILQNNLHRLCITYQTTLPHGNSKEDKPFFSTLSSTMAMNVLMQKDQKKKRLSKKCLAVLAEPLTSVSCHEGSNRYLRPSVDISNHLRFTLVLRLMMSLQQYFMKRLWKIATTKRFVRDIKMLH